MFKTKKKKVYILGVMLLTICTVFILSDYETLSMEITQIVDSESQKIPVLLYHHILRDEENKNFRNNDSVITYKQFYDQMTYIRDNNIQTIDSNDLNDYLTLGKALPANCVVITFDDGYLSNYQYAYQVMKEFGLKGDIFLVTSEIQKYPLEFNPDFLPMLDWGRIDEMKDIFTFYSHTDKLHKYVGKKPALKALKKGEIKTDLETSYGNTTISKLAFAYPYGAYDNKVINILKESNVKLAYTVKKGYVTKYSNPYKLRRFVITPKTTMMDYKEIFENI